MTYVGWTGQTGRVEVTAGLALIRKSKGEMYETQ
jgi:hypothetical protein